MYLIVFLIVSSPLVVFLAREWIKDGDGDIKKGYQTNACRAAEEARRRNETE